MPSAQRYSPDVRRGLYGVLGSGISYSRSPEIFRSVFDHLGWPAVYALIDLTGGARRLDRFMRSAADAGFLGISVTKPFKQRVVEYCDRLDPSARAIGAVNTVAIKAGRMTGYNTDVNGIVASLASRRKAIRNGHALLFGAGGAASAVAYTLINHFRVGRLIVVSRVKARANRLIESLDNSGKRSCECLARSWDGPRLADDIADASIIVNATPLGSGDLRRQSPLPPRARILNTTVVFDLVYDPFPTQFLRSARRMGCRTVIDGRKMLVAQAESSFAIWTGRRFPAAVRRTLLEGHK